MTGSLFPDDGIRQPAPAKSKSMPPRPSPPKKEKRVEEGELSEEETNERFYANTSMIGIVAPFPGPRFCWLLDQHFRTAFENRPDDTLEMMVGRDGKVLRRKKSKKGKTKVSAAPAPSLFGPATPTAEPGETAGDEVGESFFFPVYCHDIAGRETYRYLVYKLRSGLISLLPEGDESLYDYIWSIQTGDPVHEAHIILDIVRRVPGVQVARQLTDEEMERCKEYLLL